MAVFDIEGTRFAEKPAMQKAAILICAITGAAGCRVGADYRSAALHARCNCKPQPPTVLNESIIGSRVMALVIEHPPKGRIKAAPSMHQNQIRPSLKAAV
jgi:hypothetical protein